MKQHRTWKIVLIALLSLAALGGGYVAYARRLSPALSAQPDLTPTPTFETGVVTQGDILITAEGSGELAPALELDLAFRIGGVLSETLVSVGDQVRKGDLLALLETDDLERAVAEASAELELARLSLADVRAGPDEADLADARAALRNAQVELQLARSDYDDLANSNLHAIAKGRQDQYNWWSGYYGQQKAKFDAGQLSQTDLDWAMAATIAAEGEWQAALNQIETAEIQAKDRLAQAQNNVQQAQARLELLESEPLTATLIRAELNVNQAELAYAEAAANLEAARLYAPFDGVVMQISALPGQKVGANTAVLTLATLQEPLIHFWLEEADLSAAVISNPVNIVFEAWPDLTFTGVIVRVNPVLTTVGNTSAVEAWARLDLGDRPVNLLSGMTADVEVIVAEARGVVLAPLEALEEISPGEYVVYVVHTDGKLEKRTVSVGLRDMLNAEIVAGLEVGETLMLEGE